MKIDGYFVIFIALLLAGAASFAAFLIVGILKRRETAKVGSIERQKVFTAKNGKIKDFLSKNKYISSFIHEMALRFSVFNTKSTAYNEGIAVTSLLTSAILTISFSCIMTAATYPLWYMGAVYSLLFAGGIALLFVGISEISVSAFTKHLPETLRILNSRYASRGNIMKAIAASMDDFQPIVKREMIRIYDALKQNDMEKIRSTFAETEEKYAGEYVTLMLELISHAYYNGGDDVVKAQFDTVTEDVIEELENRKDVRQASLGYSVMSLLFIPLLPLAAAFNNSILESSSSEYYVGITGTIYAAVYIASVFLLILTIFLLERKEK